VRQGYLEQIASNPERYRKIDATLPEEQVWTSLMAVLHQFAGARV
jgi:thymidylate kinase